MALTCDRFGGSNRSTKAITSSILHDVGMVTDDDYSYVSDKKNQMRKTAQP